MSSNVEKTCESSDTRQQVPSDPAALLKKSNLSADANEFVPRFALSCNLNNEFCFNGSNSRSQNNSEVFYYHLAPTSVYGGNPSRTQSSTAAAVSGPTDAASSYKAKKKKFNRKVDSIKTIITDKPVILQKRKKLLDDGGGGATSSATSAAVADQKKRNKSTNPNTDKKQDTIGEVTSSADAKSDSAFWSKKSFSTALKELPKQEECTPEHEKIIKRLEKTLMIDAAAGLDDSAAQAKPSSSQTPTKTKSSSNKPSATFDIADSLRTRKAKNEKNSKNSVQSASAAIPEPPQVASKGLNGVGGDRGEIKRGKQKEYEHHRDTVLKKHINVARGKRQWVLSGRSADFIKNNSLHHSAATQTETMTTTAEAIASDSGSNNRSKNDELLENKMHCSFDVSDSNVIEDVCLRIALNNMHSRKFRSYCDHLTTPALDECVRDMMETLVRFQDRVYHKETIEKYRIKRRFVLGLREVKKFIISQRARCAIIAPNIEKLLPGESPLDDTITTLIESCQINSIPYVFCLTRNVLGKICNKPSPVSIAVVLNEQGAEEKYKLMLELREQAQQAYDLSISNDVERIKAEFPFVNASTLATFPL